MVKPVYQQMTLYPKLSVICLDLYRECVPRKVHQNSNDFKNKRQTIFYGISIENTVKFNKSGFSIKRHSFLRSRDFVNIK